MDVIHKRPFRILTENASSSVIIRLKHQPVAITSPPPLELITHKDEPSSYPVLHLLPDSVNIVYYKQGTWPSPRTASTPTVEEYDDDRLSNHLQHEETVVDRYEKHRPEFLNILKEPADISDDHLGRITASSHQIRLTSDNIRPLHSAHDRAGLATRQFLAKQIARIPKEARIEPTTT